MPTIRVKDESSIDMALRRFKRACEKAAILTEVRRREFREKPTEKRKRRAAAARKRFLKKRLREMPQKVQRGASSTQKRGRPVKKEGATFRSKSD